MRTDTFGNLEQWGRVLERLQELTRDGRLDEYQEAILTLLRYRDNWRLREAALESIRSIRHPSEALIRQVCRIMSDQGAYYQLRVLAAEALQACLERLADSSEPAVCQLRRELRSQMHQLLDSQDVPVLHQAVRRILPKVE